jgi:hypothetical protein
MERNESACTGRIPGAPEKCLSPPAEDRPQATSTLKKGNLRKEDKPNKPIPKEAERVEDRLLYGTPRAKGYEADTVQDRQDPGWS